MAEQGPTTLWGRSGERRRLDDALAAVRRGESAVLVVRGEAGVGKTALLQYAAGQATDCRVARIAGVESELELPFAALHQLCAPMLGGLAALPEPQEHALQVTFGLASGDVPDRFLVGLAVLSLLAEEAAKQPLVCLVDDTQWLDQATRQVLGIVARRLLAESVLLLFGVRETDDERLLPGLSELTLQGLEAEDARLLLAAAVTGPVDDRVGDRLVAETGGNPLALLELVKGTSEAELAGGFAIPSTASSVPDQLHDRYLQRVRALPEPARRLLLLAAADPTGDPALLWRAAQILGVGRDAVGSGEVRQLLEVGSAVRFRHPLMRAAAYAAGSSEDRRAAHLAVATATDAKTDPDRRAWHFATAATAPDEDLATELERSAERAHARAGLAGCAAFLERSVALTPEAERRTDRALAAAHAHLHAGTLEAGLGLLAVAEADAVTDLQRARVEQLRGEISRASTSGSQAPVLLLQAARRLETLEPRLARETYLDAWGAALVAGHLAAPGGTLRDVSAAARPASSASGPVEPGDLLLDGLATVILEGPESAEPSLRQAVDAFVGDQLPGEHWLHWGTLASNAALALWDVDCWDRVSARHVELARTSGALAPLAAALNVRRVVAIWCGDFETAITLGLEEQVVKEVTGARRASYGGLFLAAYQGQPDQATPLITATADEALVRGEGLGQQIADRATALLQIGLGHYAEGMAAADRAATGNFGPFTWQALPDLVEAATRAGQPDVAADAMRRLQAATAITGSDWAVGLEARSRALLAEGEAAEQAYAEALERLGRTPLRPELARARLLYGEWLRREGRRVDARDYLHAAFDAFSALGAEAFAERARRELLATGEKVRKRRPDTLHDLTPQEDHIARLARDGRTNPEIAAELYISTRTVEWHLRKVFGKLGIRSRKELRGALPAGRRYGHGAG
ncbi:ATP-binding protein [Nocardioides iriomotensis]|uniref:Helix-turn-helix transcriptional regulator n=1 Tax=Nocardioides iriomotensis TaxID=715784 RepID=A0A4Q5JAA4_9ACTN|nr:LuxR family transcriptional regulator [Nocardioides iriomotensis]RYU14919.1 helix-turn-helix transcriptional regulator [Nocardioides iriomotensis]